MGEVSKGIDPREASRLGALAWLGLSEPLDNPALEDIPLLASLLCGVPCAAMVVVGADEAWTVAKTGMTETRFLRVGLDGFQTLLYPQARVLESVDDSGIRDTCALLRNLPDVKFYAGAPLKDANGEVLGALVVLDAAPRTLSPEQMLGLEALARQAMRLIEPGPRAQEREALFHEREKLASAGRIAARIAHEINNPLAGIKNSFLLLKDAIPEDHRYAHYVPRVQKEIDRIARIVRQMLDLYQPKQEQERPFPVEYTMQEVLSFVEPGARERGVQLKLEMGQSGNARVPEGSFRQIMYNLIQNAIDASPPGCTVLVHAEVENGILRCRVADCGPGIPQELQAYVFEPFFSTKTDRPGMGLGLGLPVSKGLAEGLGGALEFASGSGSGTVFTVTLPLEQPTQGV